MGVPAINAAFFSDSANPVTSMLASVGSTLNPLPNKENMGVLGAALTQITGLNVTADAASAMNTTQKFISDFATTTGRSNTTPGIGR